MMNEYLFTLPTNIQIMLASGFVGFYVNTVGRTVDDNMFKLFQILVFGTFGTIGLFLFEYTIQNFNVEISNESKIYLVYVCTISVISSISLAVLWRKCGQILFIKLMEKLGVYYDDHYETAYDSFINMLSSKNINYIDIELHNGRTMRSRYCILKKIGIKNNNWLSMNRDGIALYITSIIDQNGDEKPLSEGKSSLTFITSSNIKYITCG